jgi:exosome complex component RRP4
MTERKVVIPGEIIVKGDNYLPGEGTEKKEGNIISNIYGLADEQKDLVKVIPLSGVYHARRGNVVIGKVENLTFNGWVIDIDTAENAFLPLSEVPTFVNKGNLDEVMDMGDMVIAKIRDVGKRNIDLTIKGGREFGRIDGGMIIKVNPSRVPRIIGKEGSMVNLIKQETGCNITIGQNGLIWVSGNKIENELFAKKAIRFVTEKSFVEGLTDEVSKWFSRETKLSTSSAKDVERKENKK